MLTDKDLWKLVALVCECVAEDIYQHADERSLQFVARVQRRLRLKVFHARCYSQITDTFRVTRAPQGDV